MDPEAPEAEAPPPALRRSTRRAAVKAVSYVATPRLPLRRTKRSSENPAPVAAVNGSTDKETNSEDGETSRKKRRLEKVGAEESSGEENDMEVQTSGEWEEDSEDPEMEMEIQTSTYRTHQHIKCPEASGDGDLPRVMFDERCQSGNTVTRGEVRAGARTVKLPTKESAPPITSAMHQASLPNRLNDPNARFAGNKRAVVATARSAATSGVNCIARHVSKGPEPALQNVPYSRFQKESQYKKKGKETRETPNIKTSSRYSCKVLMQYLGCLALLLLLVSAALLAYKKIPALQRLTDGAGYVSSDAKLAAFADRLSLLEDQFPSQRQELWKRSKIHLERHLRTAQPTEPVSLILTAGRKANKTLHCLARGLASSFSSALNASVLHIDGASKASQDSDEVKLEIDSQLKAAFEGNKPAAVVHHLEELPPGSTLIFYRYCDHESAAYKRAFLLFTVLLPQDEISGDKCLKDVEEMVQDYVKERLVGSGSRTSFNDMDTDKYGGLWSRISHLILPVVSEKDAEQSGCR